MCCQQRQCCATSHYPSQPNRAKRNLSGPHRRHQTSSKRVHEMLPRCSSMINCIFSSICLLGFDQIILCLKDFGLVPLWSLGCHVKNAPDPLKYTVQLESWSEINFSLYATVAGKYFFFVCDSEILTPTFEIYVLNEEITFQI